jgi:hypothetical protein
MRWSVLIDGGVWLLLGGLSVLAMFDRLSSPWLLIVSWFALHPAVMLIYFFSRWTLYYPRYIWPLATWAWTSNWLWLYQSSIFVNHIVAKGFAADLDLVDSGSATFAAGVVLYTWIDAFWNEMLVPFELVRVADLQSYRSRMSRKDV